MALWSAVVTKLKEILGKMFGVKTIKDILHVTPLVSQKMEDAIVLWDKLYRDEAPWLHEPDKDNPVRITSLGLPAMIASEKARMALLELTSEITVPVVENEEANPNFRVGIRDNAETALGTENVSDGLNAISKKLPAFFRKDSFLSFLSIAVLVVIVLFLLGIIRLGW